MRVREGQAQIDEVVDGLVDPEDGEEYAGAGVSADEDESDDGPAGGMSSKQLEDLRVKALAKFDEVGKQFDKMRLSYEKDGYKSDIYVRAQESIQNELMGIRFTAKMVEKLATRCATRSRKCASSSAPSCTRVWTVPACRARTSSRSSPATKPTCMVVDEVAAGHPYAETLERQIPAVQELQQKLIDLQTRVVLPLRT